MRGLSYCTNPTNSSNYTDIIKQKLDRQLRNFYIGLEKIIVLREQEDFETPIGQGEDIINKFNYYFGCKDFFDFMEIEKNKPRVIHWCLGFIWRII